MLKAFRDNLKKLVWILWLVIAAFVLLVFVDFGGAGYQGPASTATAVTVGDHEISFSAFRRRYELSERQAQAVYGASYSAELAQQLGLAVAALDALVAQRILVEEAGRMGLTVSQTEIQDAILQVPEFQDEHGHFIGQENYLLILQQSSFAVADFEEDISAQVLIDKLTGVLGDTVYVADSEVEDAYRNEVETAKIRYLSVPTGTFRDLAAIEEGDLEQYFDEHRADFHIPERRTVDYILVEGRLLRPTIEIDDAALRAYYDANNEEFTQEEQVRARHLLLTAEGEDEVASARAEIESLKKRIEEGGEDFGALAKELSKDEISRDRGGELGFFTRGQFNPELEEAAFSGTPGELLVVESNLITHTGVHLVEILARREGGLQGFESVRPRIHSRILGERSESAAEALAKTLAARIDSEGLQGQTGLGALAEAEVGASFATTPAFSRDDNIAGIGRGTPFTTTSFGLEEGATSEPIQVSRGWAILQLREAQGSRAPSMEEVDSELREAVLRFKQEEAAKTALGEALERVRAGLAFAELAAELGLEVQDSSDFSRSGFIAELGSHPELSDEAFELEVGGVGGPYETPQGSVIYQLAERTEWNADEFAQKESETRDGLSQERLNSLLLSLIEQRRLELEVHYNQDLLESFGVLGGAEASS